MDFSFKDLEILAETIATYKCESDLIVQDKIDSWMNVLEDLKKKYADVKEVISDMLADQYGLCREQCNKKEGPINFIFNTPLQEMPPYINSEIEWQAVVSLWRLAIDK